MHFYYTIFNIISSPGYTQSALPRHGNSSLRNIIAVFFFLLTYFVAGCATEYFHMDTNKIHNGPLIYLSFLLVSHCELLSMVQVMFDVKIELMTIF